MNTSGQNAHAINDNSKNITGMESFKIQLLFLNFNEINFQTHKIETKWYVHRNI